MSDPIALVPGKTDTELAKDFRERLAQALQPICLIFDEAVDVNLAIRYELGIDFRKKHVVTKIEIVKTL